jgi:dethiobiotin synthetase
MLGEVLYITGTDTGVGKTIATATLASAFSAAGRSVAVYKPTQPGLEDGRGDIDTVARLAGVSAVSEGIRLKFPMAPVPAAEREGVTLPPAATHIKRIGELASDHDTVLVEGAGGLLVELDHDGATLPDIFVPGGRFLVVCRAGLGTLNHTMLTLEALRTRGRPVGGLIFGSWPHPASEIEHSNRAYLENLKVPVLGAIPAGASNIAPDHFRKAASEWLFTRVNLLEWDLSTVPR